MTTHNTTAQTSSLSEAVAIGQYNAPPPTLTNGNASPLQLDSSGNLLVNVKAGGTVGGTSSSFNSAFPSTGTAAGLEYLSSAPTLTSGNMAAFQGDVNGNLKVNLQTALPAGSNAIGSVTANAGTNLNTSALALESGGNLASIKTQTATTAAGTSAANALPVQGVTGGIAMPVNGTVTANAGTGTFGANVSQVGGSAVSTAASGVQKVGITGSTGAAVDAAGQNASSPASELIVGGQFNSTPTTITSGNVSPLQLDSSGNLLVNVKAGGAAGGTSSSFGSAFPSTGTAIGAKSGSDMVSLQADSSSNLLATVQATTAGGVSTYAALGGTGNALLTNSTVLVTAGMHNLYSVDFYNSNAFIAYVQIFDAASAAAVTLGTTAPKLSYPVPAGGWWDKNLADIGASFVNGIVAAATATSTGSLAPSSGVQAHFYYK